MIFNHLLSIHCCALFFTLLKICLPPIHIVVPFCDLTRKNAWKFVLVVLVKPPICDFGITPQPGERGLSQFAITTFGKNQSVVFTVHMVLTLDMVYTIDTVDTVYNIQTALHCLTSSMYAYIY